MYRNSFHAPGHVYLRWLRLQMLHWTQLAFARNKDGESVPYNDKDAVSWDVHGAMSKLHGAMQWEIQKRMDPYTKTHLVIWNDRICKSKDDVISVINILLKEFE